MKDKEIPLYRKVTFRLEGTFLIEHHASTQRGHKCNEYEVHNVDNIATDRQGVKPDIPIIELLKSYSGLRGWKKSVRA